MNEAMMSGFVDELEKISSNGGAVREALSKIWPAVKKHWKLPAAAVGGAAVYAKGKQMKRRYDIGKMVEESQAQRG